MFSSDEEALDAVKSWWRENGAFVIAGLAIGIALVAGWRFWEASQDRAAEEAAALYQQIQSQAMMEELEPLRDPVERLRDDYGRTAYAAQGALSFASVAVSAGELEEAAEWLEWAWQESVDREIGILAAVRLARIHLAREDPESSLAVLDQLDAGAFVNLAEEVRGDALYAQGDRAAARSAYRRALDAEEAREGQQPRPELEMKYHDLADSEE